jgi:hypothetical protein
MKKFLNKFFIAIILVSAVYLPVRADMLKTPAKAAKTEANSTVKKTIKSPNLIETVSSPSTKTNALSKKHSSGFGFKKILYLGAGFIAFCLFVAIYIAKFLAGAKNRMNSKDFDNFDINQNESLGNISLAVSSFVKHRIRK